MHTWMLHRFLLVLTIVAFLIPQGTAFARDAKIEMPSGTILEIVELDFSLVLEPGSGLPGEADKSRKRVVKAVAAVHERGESDLTEMEIADELFTFVVGAFANQRESRFVTISVEPAGPPAEGEDWIEDLTVSYEKSSGDRWINKTTNEKVEINRQD